MDTLVASSSDPDLLFTERYPFSSARSNHKSLRRRTLNHRVRLAAKRYAAEHPTEQDVCQAIGLPCSHNQPSYDLVFGSESSQHRRPQGSGGRRLHLEQSLARHERAVSAAHGLSAAPRSHHNRKSANLQDDSIALARSSARLPCDRHRSLQRTPSLEREDAFCDASTFRQRAIQIGRLPAGPMDEDTQVAELYRMGLLYDDADKARNDSASFGLNNIHHDAPIYSIRPARRSQKHGKSKGYGKDEPLNLDLSFADLGKDGDLAQYLSASADSTDAGSWPIQHSAPAHASDQEEAAPLRVVYELETSQPSFDVDTSQPPDLVTDILSEYDYFSDSELDDTGDVPSQREVYDESPAATSSSGVWVLLGDDS
ncbi:unnamed protein product [Clonostachys chloroleuca]|uniref:Uncharacterized protein n=1 Tax=Clonostachys chloroleuca TaxID=1926264 RepID=A0AA35Q9H4_9HYPO|nr:unnamed protein product [Clonostachys chloroleuca]